MGRTEGRSPEDTRDAILGAAHRLFLADGLQASLAQVAREAGISKGGLIYHFASKDDLVEALATRMIHEFRQEVEARVEAGDTDPGRLVRAYVRVSVDPATDQTLAQERQTLEAILGTVPVVQEIWRSDSQWWRDTLAADGLPEGIRDLVVAAADGVWTTMEWGVAYPPARMVALRDRLLALTREQ